LVVKSKFQNNTDMRYFLLTLAFTSLLLLSSQAIDQLPVIENHAFKTGEKLTFELSYSSMMTGDVTAGIMTSKIHKNKWVISGDTTYRIKVTGKTKGAFNWFFKVNDVYQTYLDEKYMVPRYFSQRVKEGEYEASRDVRFFHESKKAWFINNKNQDSDTVQIDYNVQDLISGMYFARTFNSDSLEFNDIISIPIFLDDSVYHTNLKFIGRKTIETSLGKVACLKFNPSVQTGGVFKDDDKLVVYISDDKNHLPILAESEVMVGKIKIELIKYSGLRNDFVSLE